MARPKVIAVARVFNEDLFLQRWLDWMARLADEMIVVDDGSWDATADILREHPLVTQVFRKARSEMTEVKDLNHLFRVAVERRAEWIVRLDSDEVLDNRIFARLDDLLQARDVGEYRFRKYWLWRSEDQIRLDRPEKFAQWNPARFVRADPGLTWRHPEGPPWLRAAKLATRRANLRPQSGHAGIDGIRGEIVDVEDAVLVHYSAVDFAKMQWKHIRYALMERQAHPRRPADDITNWAYSLLDESTLELGPVPDEWKPLA